MLHALDQVVGLFRLTGQLHGVAHRLLQLLAMLLELIVRIEPGGGENLWDHGAARHSSSSLLCLINIFVDRVLEELLGRAAGYVRRLVPFLFLNLLSGPNLNGLGVAIIRFIN